MITATLSAILGFLVKALSFALGVVLFVVPIVANVSFGLFILATSSALFWMILVGLTIFLAPTGGVRKHLDISYPDIDDPRPFDEKTKERIQMEEIVLTLALPWTYLPELVKETGISIVNFIVRPSR